MEDVMEDLLVHYGKMGMKWGVRAAAAKRTASAGYGPQPIMIGERRGKPLVSVGGRGHPATDEARRAVGLKQKAKKSGIQSLSNKEIKELNERLSLEQNYSKLTGADAQRKKGKGRRFAENVLKKSGDVVASQATKQVNDAINRRVAASLAKKAAAAAGTGP